MAKSIITNVFCKLKASKARELEKEGVLEVISLKDFPNNAPIHMDGSIKYDPKKVLVILAVRTTSYQARQTWNCECEKIDKTYTAKAV